MKIARDSIVGGAIFLIGGILGLCLRERIMSTEFGPSYDWIMALSIIAIIFGGIALVGGIIALALFTAAKK